MNQSYASVCMHPTLCPCSHKVFGVHFYKNNAHALLSHILNVLNSDWLHHEQSVCRVYEYHIFYLKINFSMVLYVEGIFKSMFLTDTSMNWCFTTCVIFIYQKHAREISVEAQERKEVKMDMRKKNLNASGELISCTHSLNIQQNRAYHSMANEAYFSITNLLNPFNPGQYKRVCTADRGLCVIRTSFSISISIGCVSRIHFG